MLENTILQAGKPIETDFQPDVVQAYRILIVDDEPLICRLNREALTEAGYEVDEAENGMAAWNKLQSRGYDLLITDHLMPEMTGVELLLRLHASHRSLPTIMISGTMPNEELERYPWLEIQARLDKPHDITGLGETVGTILRATAAARGQMELMPYMQTQPADAALRV